MSARNTDHFIKGVDYSWQSTTDFNTIVTDFHKNRARRPEGEMTRAKKLHTMYTTEIEKKLKRFCSRLEYTGSAYEGVNVSNDIEFDIMVIMDGGKGLEVVPTAKVGYFLLKPAATTVSTLEVILKSCNSDGYISANKMATSFLGQLRKCIEEIKQEYSEKENAPDELKTIYENIKLSRHGPAVQMDVKYDNIDYSVDMVPTFEVDEVETSEKMFVVAKPLKGVHQDKQLQQAWRQSFSLAEKDRFARMDNDNGCRKQVLRILKVLRNREPGLANLTSYHLKTALFYELDDTTKEWKPAYLGQRVMNMLARLIACLNEAKMSHYYLKKDIDLLEGIKPKAIENMRDRLKHLNNSEKKIRKIFES